MIEQDFPDNILAYLGAADTVDLVGHLAGFDDGIAIDDGPSVVIEGTDNCPDFVGRVIRGGAVS